eukprot:gene5734-9557_t
MKYAKLIVLFLILAFIVVDAEVQQDYDDNDEYDNRNDDEEEDDENEEQGDEDEEKDDDEEEEEEDDSPEIKKSVPKNQQKTVQKKAEEKPKSVKNVHKTNVENIKILENKEEKTTAANNPKKNITHFWKKLDEKCGTTCRIILGVSGVCLISLTGLIVLAGVMLVHWSNKKKITISPDYQETWI